MSINEETRQEVNRRLKRLKREYGDFSVKETTVTNEPDFFEHGRQLAKDGWIGDAGAWVTDEQDRVLLIQHRDGPTEWGTPGGGHEPGETMEETARREVREDTGVERIDPVEMASVDCGVSVAMIGYASMRDTPPWWDARDGCDAATSRGA